MASVLVTGTNKGIGLEAALAFGRAGYRVHAHRGRFASLFKNSLRNPMPPSLVGEKILGIVKGGTWQLRHPVGSDAQPLLQRRSGMTDEQWIEFNASDDVTWYRNMGLELAAARTA